MAPPRQPEGLARHQAWPRPPNAIITVAVATIFVPGLSGDNKRMVLSLPLPWGMRRVALGGMKSQRLFSGTR